jgi:hypothetical protein
MILETTVENEEKFSCRKTLNYKELKLLRISSRSYRNCSEYCIRKTLVNKSFGNVENFIFQKYLSYKNFRHQKFCMFVFSRFSLSYNLVTVISLTL